MLFVDFSASPAVSLCRGAARPDIAHAFSVGVMRQRAFRSAWAVARGCSKPTASEMDAVLHEERLLDRRKRAHRILGDIAELPDRTIVCRADEAFTMVKGKAFRWTDTGYDPPETILHADSPITPPSSVMALQARYRAVLHPFINLC